MNPNDILAYVHIEKAAGTTFNSILQRNFMYKHCDVKPLFLDDKGVFSARSMKTLLRVNPFIKSISGHSVQPHGDLSISFPHVKYVTLLRDPVFRYISQYQYHVDRRESRWSFQHFLEKKFAHNFQTKKIAGEENITKAKEILVKKFLLVGLTEEFESFLYILQNKLYPLSFDINYKIKNRASNNKIKKKIVKHFDEYRDVIVQNNYLDIQLYEFVKNRLFRNEKKILSSKQKEQRIDVKKENINQNKINFLLYKIYRKIYYEQTVKVIRILNRSNRRRYY